MRPGSTAVADPKAVNSHQNECSRPPSTPHLPHHPRRRWPRQTATIPDLHHEAPKRALEIPLPTPPSPRRLLSSSSSVSLLSLASASPVITSARSLLRNARGIVAWRKTRLSCCRASRALTGPVKRSSFVLIVSISRGCWMELPMGWWTRRLLERVLVVRLKFGCSSPGACCYCDGCFMVLRRLGGLLAER
ncbi:hypothetical protein BJ508DRAFT_161252 [Ascobolus immersus RN42]|uniref:Uncharacterized protein n=1 Tax=Ascobolus immersus RN42 TaxID=1160509 RepID=A0A3N4HW93_ASCIM|nr:hypothetical protein BJ508DRAFT_161252 [Ascobolus immersus RN42]